MPCEESCANDFTHEAGLHREEVTKRYSHWAQDAKYEWDLREEHYKGPEIASNVIAKLFPERSGVKVLDMAAGSGFVAEKLRENGFQIIDALEPSDAMIKLAKPKCLYTRTFQEYLNSKATLIEPDYYDACVTSGGMGEGHIPCSGLNEMIRVVKPDGYIVLVMREAYLQTVMEYKDKLEPHMVELEKAGLWASVSRTVVPCYSFNNNGIVFVFRKQR